MKRHTCFWDKRIKTQYLRSFNKTLMEVPPYGMSGVVNRRYIYAGNDRIAMKEMFGNEETLYYLKDHLGTTRVLLDSIGVPKDIYYDYRAFGKLEGGTVSTDQKYLYTGKPFDEDGGINLYYYGARYYDHRGRFLTIDPLHGKYPSLSPYAYCANNPLKFVDPDGRWLEHVHHSMFNVATGSMIQDGSLTQNDVEAMKAGSDWADIPENQTADKSFMHAMSDGSTNPPQSPEDAARATQEHIQSKTSEFVKTGDFKALGVAVHAIQDSNSPSHEGSQPWTGNETVMEKFMHGLVEAVPSRKRAQIGTLKTKIHIRRAIMLRNAIIHNEVEELSEDK